MAREPDKKIVQDFYTEVAQREIRIQHILYDADDSDSSSSGLIKGGSCPTSSRSSVLGRYSSIATVIRLS